MTNAQLFVIIDFMKKIDVKGVLDGLTALYPDAKPELDYTNPYELIVAVILSAQCTA